MPPLPHIPKALERHTLALYAELESMAKPDPELDNALIVETRLSYQYQVLSIPTSYYATIREILFDGLDPCCIMLQRGMQGKPSVICLRHPPDSEIFTNRVLTERKAAATVFLDAARRIEKLEAWQESLSPADGNSLNVIEAIRNHEKRLAALESQITQAAAIPPETEG